MDTNVRHFTPHDPADTDALSRPTPRDVEAEALMCGAIMYSAQAYTDCAAVLQRDDIYHPPHLLIWDTVGGMIAQGKQLHPVAVRAEIAKQKRLREVDNGAVIDALARDTITAGMAASFAEQIAEAARLRRHQEHATRIHSAILRGEQPDTLDQLAAEFQRTEEVRSATVGHGPGHLTAALLDWGPFFQTDFGKIELLPGRLLAPGQQITLVGDGKAGKSLLAQEWALRMANGQSFLGDRPQPPIPLLYVDAENGHQDIQERFISYGGGSGSMGLLSYASFPPIRPLDTAGGGADLMAMVRECEAQVVFLDTVSRFISGPENDADTWLSLYRHTLLPLKRAGIASVRLDHMGKDGERGARGSSAKTQDVDHVWELRAQGGGSLLLKRTHTRTGIGPDVHHVVRQAQRDGDSWRPGGTRHVLMTFTDEPTALAAVPGTPEFVVAQLDRAGVPSDWGVPRVSKRLAEMGVQARKDKIETAVRIRKSRLGATDETPDFTSPQTSPQTSPVQLSTNLPPRSGAGEAETAGHTSPGEVGGTSPHVNTAPPSPRPPSQEGGGGADRGTPTRNTKPLCTVCQTPINAQWAARGYATHIGCDPTTGTPTPDPDEAA